MKELLQEAMAIKDTIIADRRHIHQNPELGMNLPNTTKYVIDRLTEMGYEPKEICQSGVVATVGKPGKTFLIRGDMDALPMDEASGLPFASTNHAAHTCGHDTHTAMMLGAAKLLKDHEDELEGTVKLMFQPAEEILAGAAAMIEGGLLENPKVDAALALHIIGDSQPAGYIAYTKGGSHGSADKFVITVYGQGGHGASPHTSRDPITVGAHIVIGLQEILAREVNPADTCVITMGAFRSGQKENIIPETAELIGTIRTKKEDVRNFAKKRMEEISKAIAAAFRCECKVEFPFGVAPLENNDELLEDLVGYTKELLGDDKVEELPGSMGSEDFAWVCQKVPGAFMRVGAKVDDPTKVFPNHNPAVLFDEDALPYGTAVYTNAAMQWLKNHK